MSRIISLAIIFSGFTSFAQTSTYQYSTEPSRATAEFLLSKSQGSVDSSDFNANNIQINLKGAITETYKFRGGVAFVDRHLTDSNDSYNVSGLSNFNLSAWGLTPFETFTMSYGLDTSLSAAPAKFTQTTGDRGATPLHWRNNFTGYNSYTAFLGSEFNIGKVMAGARANLTYFQSRFSKSDFAVGGSTENSLSADNTGVGAEAFAEVPMHRLMAVGVAAGTLATTGSGANLGDLVLGRADNSLYSTVYGTYKYDAETSFVAGLRSSSQRIYLATDSTDLTLGVTHAL